MIDESYFFLNVLVTTLTICLTIVAETSRSAGRRVGAASLRIFRSMAAPLMWDIHDPLEAIPGSTRVWDVFSYYLLASLFSSPHRFLTAQRKSIFRGWIKGCCLSKVHFSAYVKPSHTMLQLQQAVQVCQTSGHSSHWRVQWWNSKPGSSVELVCTL